MRCCGEGCESLVTLCCETKRNSIYSMIHSEIQSSQTVFSMLTILFTGFNVSKVFTMMSDDWMKAADVAGQLFGDRTSHELLCFTTQ